LDNSNIKKSSVVSSNNNGYAVYLQLEFNKDSIEKLKEISNKYIETEKEENKKEDQDENQENVEDSEKEIKYISIVVDGTKLMKTYFSDEISQGIIQIPIGNQTNDYEKFIENSNYAKLISTRLNTGILPIAYELETDNFVKSEFNLQNCRNLLIFGISFIVIASIAFIIKYRKNGLLGAILCIGYIGTLTIVIKYTNTEITQNSIITAFLMIFLNYIFVKLLLKKLINIPNDIDKAYLEVSKKFYLSIIPIVIISLVFTLDSNYIINTIGMMVFWNIVLNIIYNLLFTKNILKK
jgi:preprotein translocase subunit SecD